MRKQFDVSHEPDCWHSQKLWLGGWRGKWKNFVKLFWWRHMSDIMANDVITDFLKFNFVTISLKKHNLVISRNFRSPILKIKGRWGRRDPSA